MDKPNMTLFHIVKMRSASTIVAETDEKRAREIAAELSEEAYVGYPEYFIFPITRRESLPEDWADSTPWGDSDEGFVCRNYFPPPPPPIDEREQHALYQLLSGSLILRPPRTAFERELYEQHGIYRTVDGIYFTTLQPLPSDVRSYAICRAAPPDLPSDAANSEGIREQPSYPV